VESAYSPYYEAVQKVFRLGPQALAERVFRIESPGRGGKTCGVSWDPLTEDMPKPVLPSRDLGILLMEALGPDRYINSPEHPIYQELIRGKKL
jgi:hypothetical protein